MIRTYKKIQINNLDLIVHKCKLIIQENPIPVSTTAYFPYVNSTDKFREIDELRIEMEKIGLYNFWFCSTIIVSYDDLPIHKDTGDFIYSLNIPIQNTSGTYTVFYYTNNPAIRVKIDGEGANDLDYYEFNDKSVKIIDKIEMIEPAIINTQVPHNVIHNTENFPRITLCLRLNLSFNPDEFL